MSYKAVIFDLDGVLVSTDEFHYLSWKSIADRLNIPFDRERNNLLRGISRMESLEILLDGRPFSLEEKVKLAEEKNKAHVKLLSTLTPESVNNDVRYTIRELKSKGIKVAIGSVSKNTKFILERVDLLNEFDAIADGTNVTKSKPDPEVFLVAASMLNLDPKDCLVVEDAIAGIDAALAGGFTPIAISDATKHEKVTYKINKLSDVLSIAISK